MANRLSVLISQAIRRRTARRWQSLADQATAMDIGPLRLVRSEAREVRRKADRVVRIADSRLTLPLVGAEIIDAPLHSDWSYRPELWRLPVRPNGLAAVANDTKIGSEAAVFHNCGLSEMTIRQVRSTREEDLAPFGLRLDVFRFSGSFLSLVIQLPPDSVNGLIPTAPRFDSRGFPRAA